MPANSPEAATSSPRLVATRSSAYAVTIDAAAVAPQRRVPEKARTEGFAASTFASSMANLIH